jgi:hypothetical protein
MRADQLVITKPTIPGPETSPWYWNPSRWGALKAPEWFEHKLRDVDPDHLIEITWNPVDERWQVWYKKPTINHALCRGWSLLFIVRNDDGSYRPLDERTLARLWEASSAKHGSGRQYWAAVQAQMEREQEAARQASLQSTIDSSMEMFDHSRISVSMRGKSNGSKFSTWHS